MNSARALTICKNLGSEKYSDNEKVKAIYAVIYGAFPFAAIDAAMSTDIAKWLFEKQFGPPEMDLRRKA